MKKIIFLILIINSGLILAAPPGLPFEIISNGYGARAYSMGGVGVTTPFDASLLLWNPSLLDSITRNELLFSFEPLYSDALINFASFAYPAGKIGGFGITLAYLNYGKYEIMSKEGNTEGEEGVSDILFAIGYGKNLFAGVQVGLNIKVAIKSFGNETFTGYNSDIGFFKSFENIDFGIVFKDILPLKIKFTYEEESFYPAVRAGITFKFFDEKLKLSTEVEKYFLNVNPEFLAGIEYFLFDNFVLRAGGNSNAILGAGTGIKYQNIFLDYALNLSETTILHKVSLHYKFGGYEIGLKAEPEIFSPLSVNKKTYIRINAKTKYEIYKWKVELRNKKGEIIKIWEGAGQPYDTVIWDGLKPDGMPQPEGEYFARLILTDETDNTIKSDEITIKLSSSEKFLMPLIGE